MKKRPRYKYNGCLAKPLKLGEAALSKLPTLLADLGAANCEDAIDVLLIRHVIEHDVRQYPIVIRGSIQKHGPARDRHQALRRLFATDNAEQILLALAIRHVPGFQSRSANRASAGGRPYRFTPEYKAWLVEIIDREIEVELNRSGKTLTILQAAKRISRSKPESGFVNPFFETPAKVLQAIHNKRKLADRQYYDLERRLSKKMYELRCRS